MAAASASRRAQARGQMRGVALTLCEKRRFLENLPLFARLDQDELATLATSARVEHHSAGGTIFLKGSPGRCMMAVLRGGVRISSPTAGGREIVLNIINPGEVFGEIALLDGLERTADAVATMDCDLLVLDRRDFRPVLLRRPDFCVGLLELLCHRLRQTSLQVEDALFERLDSRVAKALFRLVCPPGTTAPAGPIPLQLSQAQLGNLVGASRESINRTLRAWQRDGIVELAKGSIVIRDISAMIRQL
jgi:CRP/FNR family transcriptional regulator, cyclic AMP receptor protein